MDISTNIRNIRKGKGITLEKLALQSGLTKGYLSRIERGTSAPSFAAFQAVANALGVEINELLDREVNITGSYNIEVFRNADNDFGNTVSDRIYSFAALLKDYKNKQIAPFLFYIKKGTTDIMSHDSEEFVYILKGKVDLDYEGKIYSLGKGDCFYLDSRIRHYFVNHMDETAELLAVNYNYRRF